ncbi:hypothetical protein EMCRGX_G005033 [Ephydatia muelleri]
MTDVYTWRESEDSSEEGATTESTPYIFNQFASALHWIMATNYAADLIHYLDDFLLAGPPGQPTCSESTKTMLRVCERLGIPVALDKLEGPATTITFLGITIDTTLQQLQLPPDKLQEMIQRKTTNGCSPLYTASGKGHLDVVKTLLEAGANINQVNKNGCSPLYTASRHGHLDVVKTLLEAGANINQATKAALVERLYLHLQDPSSEPEPEHEDVPNATPESEDSSESSSEGATTESTLYIFNQFASALHWIMATNYAADLIHYLDDFLLAGPPGQPTCSESTETMLRVCERLGIPVALDKLEGPVTTITFLGITINTTLQQLQLPPDKLQDMIQRKATCSTHALAIEKNISREVEVRVGEGRGGKVREIEDNRVNPNMAEKLHSTETTLDPASGDVNSSREGDVDRGQTQEHRNTETERERCRDEGSLVEVEERTIPVDRVERIVVEVEERGVTANRAEKERKSGSSPPPKDELGSTEELLKELADTSFINQIASHHWTFLDSCIANKVYPLGMKAFVPCAVYKANDDLRKQWKVILNNTALELVEVCRKHYEKLINSSTDKINQLYVKGEQLRSEEDRVKFQRKRATIEEEVKRRENEMSKSRRKKLQNTIRKHKEGRVFVENCLVENNRHQVENETEVRQRSEKERDSASKRPETPVVRNITAAPQSTKTTSSEDKDTRVKNFVRGRPVSSTGRTESSTIEATHTQSVPPLIPQPNPRPFTRRGWRAPYGEHSISQRWGRTNRYPNFQHPPPQSHTNTE